MSSILQPRMRFRRLKPPVGARLIRGHPLAKGLVGCWLLNEGGGDKVHDLSGYGHQGTLTNMAFPSTLSSGWNPGLYGSALAFDGTNDYVTIPSCFPTDPTEVSVSVRVKADGASSEYRPFSYNEEGFYLSTRINEGGTANKIYTFMYDGAVDAISTTAYSVTDWVHIVVTSVENGNTKLYVNGIYIGSDTATGSFTEASDLGRTIGASRDAISSFVDGLIDEVRLWSRALTANEILELYLNPYGMFEWPMAWLGAVVAVGNPWYAYAQM